jgi:TolB-like protein/Tfp pilus assembly protein PilF
VFFITLVLAWHHGEKGRQRVTLLEIIALAGLVAATGSAAPLVWSASSASSGLARRSEDRRPSIMVLPLDNMSPDPNDDFFAGGVQESLTEKLSRISTLTVKSRTTADRFRDRMTRPSIPEIARSAGADYLIEGSTRIDGDSIWITVQLIEGASDNHRWVETYAEPYTTEGYTRLQAEIVQRIAADLRHAISPKDRVWLDAVPTANLAAFEKYMRGWETYRDEIREGLVSTDYGSTNLLEEAVQLDPQFAVAYAALAYTLNRGANPKPEQARRAAERALALGWEIPEARLVLSDYFGQLQDFAEAERHLALALEVAPEHPDVLEAQSAAQRRMGDIDGALKTLHRAERVHPLDPRIPGRIGRDLFWLHRYEEALAAFERELSRWDTPTPIPFLWQAMTHLARGDTALARTATRNLLATDETYPYGFIPIYQGWFVIRFMTPEDRQQSLDAVLLGAQGHGQYLSCANPDIVQTCLRRAVHESEVGSVENARILWDSLAALVPHEHAVDQQPTALTQVLIYMGLGEKEPALETAWAAANRWAPEGCGKRGGASVCGMLARALAHFGESGEAIDVIEEMLPAPSLLTVHILEIDPIWDPLRPHPRFQALLEQYADDVEH